MQLSGDEMFQFDSQGSTISAGNLTNIDGYENYTILPRKFTDAQVSERSGNPFLHRGMRVLFTVTDENNPNNSITKTVYLRHQHFAIISRDIRHEVKFGRPYTFNVLSNTSWEIDKIEDEGIAISKPSIGDSGGNNIVDGNPINFTTVSPSNGIVPALGQAGRRMTVYLKDKQGYIPGTIPFTVTGVYNDPNSYILNPASANLADRQAHIPIRKLFQAWEFHAEQPITNLSQGQLEAKVVWDAVFLNSDINGAEQNYTIDFDFIPGTNILDDILQVTIPQNSNISGNALVGVRRQGTNEWLYSWHLWIVDYDPDTDPFITGAANYQFMRWPLGALDYSDYKTEPSNRGFYFQWGRKDPFREKSISPSPTFVIDYNNIGNSLSNPMVIYYGNASDWATNSVNGIRNYMWNDIENEKGIFDPCPKGWRVPGSKHGELENQFSNVYAHSGNIVGGVRVNARIVDWTTNVELYAPVTGYYTSNGQWKNGIGTGDSLQIIHALCSPSNVVNSTSGTFFMVSANGSPLNITNEERQGLYTVRCVKEQ
ncbi:MAG: fibrobacter succinogenes major paralogous domain-containing protein [Odoribacter sp.]|nr:fibrobacter succinogenes major paralogous domain-containing protein [Odoribacter sp.]